MRLADEVGPDRLTVEAIAGAGAAAGPALAPTTPRRRPTPKPAQRI